MKWTGVQNNVWWEQNNVWWQRTSWDVLVMVYLVREELWWLFYPARVMPLSFWGQCPFPLNVLIRDVGGKKYKRTIFSSQKPAVTKGRQLVCSAVSLCSYPPPLASALLHFENQIKEKKQTTLFKTTEKTSPEDKIRSDPEELNLLWLGSQLPYVALDALLRPMPPRLPQGNRPKGGDEACQCVHPTPDSPGRHGGTVAWAPGAGFFLLPCSVSPDHQQGSVLFGLHQGVRNQRDSSEGQQYLFLAQRVSHQNIKFCSGAAKGKCFLKCRWIHHSNNELRVLFKGLTIQITEMFLASKMQRPNS